MIISVPDNGGAPQGISGGMGNRSVRSQLGICNIDFTSAPSQDVRSDLIEPGSGQKSKPQANAVTAGLARGCQQLPRPEQTDGL